MEYYVLLSYCPNPNQKGVPFKPLKCLHHMIQYYPETDNTSFSLPEILSVYIVEQILTYKKLPLNQNLLSVIPIFLQVSLQKFIRKFNHITARISDDYCPKLFFLLQNPILLIGGHFWYASLIKRPKGGPLRKARICSGF